MNDPLPGKVATVAFLFGVVFLQRRNGVANQTSQGNTDHASTQAKQDRLGEGGELGAAEDCSQECEKYECLERRPTRFASHVTVVYKQYMSAPL